ncbi:hypothetical protein F5146DRAFT_1005202 [Armillaria mellea]|nr:hypothetical protein F5146DRAFT_1005202 [Armillaria mellea]
MNTQRWLLLLVATSGAHWFLARATRIKVVTTGTRAGVFRIRKTWGGLRVYSKSMTGPGGPSLKQRENITSFIFFCLELPGHSEALQNWIDQEQVGSLPAILYDNTL